MANAWQALCLKVQREAWEGKRVRFIRHGEPDPAPLTRGEEGVVDFVDDGGTVHVNWDSGRRLGLITGVDEWEEIK